MGRIAAPDFRWREMAMEESPDAVEDLAIAHTRSRAEACQGTSIFLRAPMAK